MPFTKTEVDIHTDYSVEAVDAEWLKQGVKSPKHLMLDPDNCILCRACEDVCPWNCIYMMSPGIVAGRGRRVGRAEVRRARTRCSSWTTTPARAARCAWTAAPPTPCTMRGCRRSSGGKREMAAVPGPNGPRPEAGRGERTGEAQAAVALGGPGPRPRDRGLEVDLPAGLDLPQGLQGHLARPRARDDEQRPVPPAPREDEAARAEADLHVLPGRSVVLPVHPADDHRHLPDVLLPAGGRRSARRRPTPTCRTSGRRCSSATSSATCTDGEPTSWCFA